MVELYLSTLGCQYLFSKSSEETRLFRPSKYSPAITGRPAGHMRRSLGYKSRNPPGRRVSNLRMWRRLGSLWGNQIANKADFFEEEGFDGGSVAGLIPRFTHDVIGTIVGALTIADAGVLGGGIDADSDKLFSFDEFEVDVEHSVDVVQFFFSDSLSPSLDTSEMKFEYM